MKPLDLSLYLVADEIHFRKGVVEDGILAAIRGGARVVQLREKNCSDVEFIKLANRVITSVKPLGIPVIINDRVEVARAVGADGVHLGQTDASVTLARKILGPEAIIGLSIEGIEQLGSLDGVDYLGVSSIFPTATKSNCKHFWGLDGLKELRGQTQLPLVAIGGLNEGNVQQVLRAGADGLAVVSAFKPSEDWQHKAMRLRALIATSI